MRLFLLLSCMCHLTCAQQVPVFDVEGHRGCRGLMPENTLPAFLHALTLGVTTLEMDVVVSQDSQVVVSHDPYFSADFSSRPNGEAVRKQDEKRLLLYQMPYAEINQYDVGIRGNPSYPEQSRQHACKPLLSDVLQQAEAYRESHHLPLFSYSIELKSDPSSYTQTQPDPATFCRLVQAVLTKHLCPSINSSETSGVNRVIIQSFDFTILKQWKQGIASGNYWPVKLSALVANLRSAKTNMGQLGFKPDVYSPFFRLLNRRKIAQLHQQGIRVIPWTVNRRKDMERLKAWGVDGLITDYPDRAKGL